MSMPVHVRSRTGFRTTAVVTNLTEDGCSLRFGSSQESMGRDIIIQPEGMEGWAGRVVWKQESSIGLQFEHRLYGPVVEHLVKRFPAS